MTIPRLPADWKIGDPIPEEMSHFARESMFKAEDSFWRLSTSPMAINEATAIDPHQKLFLEMRLNSKTKGGWGVLTYIVEGFKTRRI